MFMYIFSLPILDMTDTENRERNEDVQFVFSRDSRRDIPVPEADSASKGTLADAGQQTDGRRRRTSI